MAIQLFRDHGAELRCRKTALVRKVTALRQSVEGGRTVVTLQGGREIPVWADSVSQGKITGAVLAGTLDPSFTLHWKGSDGEFYVLNAAEILLVAQGVRAHVQAAFDRESALHNAIAAADTLTVLLAIDLMAGWPSTPPTEATS